ncbi:hypothetical protein [uncultured Croceitalea sp.]|uniref:hypothetical protein n=1 Tax=uncultured Croceitalea sp. TaxID=1798908 RepID=UPI00374F4AD9
MAYNSLAQDNLYIPKSKHLEEFQTSAPEYLIKRLDSIFTSKKEVKLNQLSDFQNITDKYQSSKSAPSSSKIDLSNDPFNWVDWAHSFYNTPKKYKFDKDYYYYLHNNDVYSKVRDSPLWASKTLKTKKIRMYIPGSQEKLFLWESILNYPEEDNMAFFFDGFVFDTLSIDKIPKSIVVNSIDKDGLSPSVYRHSILKNNHDFRYSSNSGFSDIGENVEEDYFDKTYKGKPRLYIDSSYVNGDYVIYSKLESLLITNTKIDSIRIWSDSINYLFVDHVMPDIFRSYEEDLLNQPVTNSQFKSSRFSVNHTVVSKAVFGGRSEYFYLNNLNSKDEVRINAMMDTLIILKGDYNRLNIFQEKRGRKNKNKIFLANFNLDGLETRWLGYELFKPDPSWTDDHMNAVYLNLLSHFEEKGYNESHEELDKQYKSWNYRRNNMFFLDWLDRNWWDYGYNKLIILRNTIYIFLFFSLINSFLLRYLSKEVYFDKKIIKAIKSNKKIKPVFRWFYNLPASFFYTSKVFFGIGFKYENLIYENKLSNYKVLYLFYFFFMFISGLVCLGYLINVVVTI